jgi:hypothetical protein
MNCGYWSSMGQWQVTLTSESFKELASIERLEAFAASTTCLKSSSVFHLKV